MSATGPTTPGERGGIFCRHCGVALAADNGYWRRLVTGSLNCSGNESGHEPEPDAAPDAERGGESGERYDHPACCGACGGTGSDYSGPCADCYGTGHPHPEDRPLPQPEPAAGDAEGLARLMHRMIPGCIHPMAGQVWSPTCEVEAAAILAAGWKSPDEVAAIAREAAERALVEAADDLALRAVPYEQHPEHETDRYLDGVATTFRVGEKVLRGRAASLGG